MRRLIFPHALILMLGAHYTYVRGNVLLFGETARSSSGGWGTVNGLLASLAPTVDVSALVEAAQKMATAVQKSHSQDKHGQTEMDSQNELHKR